MPFSFAKVCAYLARAAARLTNRFPDLSVFSTNGADWLVFSVRRGPVPADVLRALAPGVRPALTPPTADELRVMNCLVGGPQTGVEIAAALDLEPTGGGFLKRMADIQLRGFVYNPGKGYRLTEYGEWALRKD